MLHTEDGGSLPSLPTNLLDNYMKKLEKESLQLTLDKIKRHQNGLRVCFTTHDVAALETAISRVTNRLSEKEWNAVIFVAIHLEHEEFAHGRMVRKQRS